MRPWKPGSGNQAIGRSPEENRRIAEELIKMSGIKWDESSKESEDG